MPTAVIKPAAPPFAFLGVCRHARAFLADPGGAVDLLGLSRHIVCPVLPVPLGDRSLVVAVYDAGSAGPIEAVIRAPDGREVQRLHVKPAQAAVSKDSLAQRMTEGWFVLATNPAGWLIDQPGYYDVRIDDAGGGRTVGGFYVSVPEEPEFSPEMRAAFQSYPAAHDAVQVVFACTECREECRAYVAYERDMIEEDRGSLWYRDLPEEFRCGCGRTVLSLSVLRRQMHLLLDPRLPSFSDMSSSRLYEEQSVRRVLDAYNDVLISAKREEDVQVFLANNPLMLAVFAAVRIFPKARILSRYTTDFVILDHKRDLILIEIERPDTPLLTSKGNTAAPLQRAFDQVTDWLHVFREHRIATLECLGLNPKDVASIRGVVIAGRNLKDRHDDLRKLRGVDRGPVSFMTFDDLALGLQRVVEQLGSQPEDLG